jgi:hypothetical protein
MHYLTVPKSAIFQPLRPLPLFNFGPNEASAGRTRIIKVFDFFSQKELFGGHNQY